MYHQWSRNGCMYTYMIKQEAESRTKLVPYFCSDDTPPFFSLTRAIIQFEHETNFCFVWFHITSKQTCDAGLLGCSTHQFWLYVLFPDQTTVGKAANKWQAHTQTFRSQPMINKLLKKHIGHSLKSSMAICHQTHWYQTANQKCDHCFSVCLLSKHLFPIFMYRMEHLPERAFSRMFCLLLPLDTESAFGTWK